MLIVGKEASEAYFTRMRSNVLFIGESKAWAKSVLRNVLKTGLALSNTQRSKRTDWEGPDMEGDDWREIPSEPLAGHRTHCRTSYPKSGHPYNTAAG